MKRPNSLTLSLADAAELLGVGVSTVYEMKDAALAEGGNGELVPGAKLFKVSRSWRVSRQAVERFCRGEVPEGGAPL